MNWLKTIGLALLFLSTSIHAADNGECLRMAVEESNNLYRTGCGCEDGVYNAVSSSMLGWGVGLFVGIALLTGLVHNAHQSSTSSSTSTNSSN